jgi:alkanesulfonate monooxygenase SsuD/methylene tetrahydromethanopterin reductase-like flavin-dependent oxidoreductase (luciferase family)
MRFGLDVAQQRLPWSQLLARAELADRAGFDGIWGFDHFVPMYGSGPGECFEGNTTLAALSGHTSTVRLGLLVTGLTYRHPSVLAAEAITIDHASGGRYELAYGAAWFDDEHRRLGIPFPPTGQRVAAFEEAVQIVRGLLTTDGFTFEGRYFQVRDATLLPRPVQSPHPPIWIGASGDRMLGIVAKYADVWHCFGDPASLTARSERLSELATAAGRDPASILRAGSVSLEGDLDDVRRTVDRWRDAGFGYLVAGWPPEGQGRVEEFAAQVLRENR